MCKKEILNELLCQVCNTLWFGVFYGDGRESNKRSGCTKPLHLVNFIHLKAYHTTMSFVFYSSHSKPSI